jgi:iron complex transport system ATP-binding protein
MYGWAFRLGGWNKFFIWRGYKKYKFKKVVVKGFLYPQSHTFSFSITGLDMVVLGRSAHLGVFEQPGTIDIELAEKIMKQIGIERLANQDCNHMSGDGLQMVLIAKALINRPDIIVLDEPETGFDFRNQILVH